MKARVVAVSLGSIIFVVLSVLVIQRLSAEAMAVFVGVVAGILASIPTSLIVVWLALRTATARTETLSRSMAEARSPEPRIVVVSPSVMPASPGYGPATPMALPAYAQPVPRRFTVIGGAEGMPGEFPENQETVWRQ
jgi:hypothetical protein